MPVAAETNKLWTRRRAVVTGAAGFLGSHLVEALVAEGARVAAVDNLSAGTAANLEAVRDDIDWVEWDIAGDSPAPAALGEAEVVFHLAALANPAACRQDPRRAWRVNVEGTRRVLEACRAGSRVVFLSGALAYGEPLALPVDELHPQRARDPYSLTKIAGESLGWLEAAARGLRLTVVRNFSTYGPRQVGDYVVPSLIRQGLDTGRLRVRNRQPTRDFTYVADTAAALVEVAAGDVLAGEVVNLGSGAETSIGELADQVAALLGGLPVEDLREPVTGSLRQRCRNSKLCQATGWRPRVNLHDGLARTIAWHERQAALAAAPAAKGFRESPTATTGGAR